MYSSNINGLECTEFEKKNIGKIIKSSKILYNWFFIYKEKPHEIRLFVSKITYKIELIFDNYLLIQKQKIKEQFTFNFRCEDLSLTIIQIGSEYDLRINCCPFLHLLSINNTQKNYQYNTNTPIYSYTKPVYNYNVYENKNILTPSDFFPHKNRKEKLFNFTIQNKQSKKEGDAVYYRFKNENYEKKDKEYNKENINDNNENINNLNTNLLI